MGYHSLLWHCFCNEGDVIWVSPGPQCKEPSKALPIGIVGSLVVVTTFYILASLTLTLMVPVADIDASAGAGSLRSMQMLWGVGYLRLL